MIRVLCYDLIKPDMDLLVLNNIVIFFYVTFLTEYIIYQVFLDFNI